MTLDIAQRYIDQHDNLLAAANRFMLDLMAGDPANFKAGYTPDNAFLATKDAFGDALSSTDLTKLRESNGVSIGVR